MTCTPPHSRCMRTRTALARRNARDGVMADEADKAVWEGRPAGWGGGPGGVAGRVGWRAGSGGGPVWWLAGRVAGRVWLRAGGGGTPGRPGGQRGMDLRSKEYSGVNVVT